MGCTAAPHSIAVSGQKLLPALPAAPPCRLSGEALPTSPTHLLSFTALIRLMHSARGQQQVAAQLPLLVQSVMRALDPSHAALRRCGWALCLPLCALVQLALP